MDAEDDASDDDVDGDDGVDGDGEGDVDGDGGKTAVMTVTATLTSTTTNTSTVTATLTSDRRVAHCLYASQSLSVSNRTQRNTTQCPGALVSHALVRFCSGHATQLR